MYFGYLFTKLLSIATVLGNLTVILLIASFLFARPIYRRLMRILGAHGVQLAALLSSGATLGSLVYSEVVGYPACILCWIQRGFMYPQMFLLSIAALRPTRRLVPISFALSMLGGAVALYNWVKDMLNVYAGVSVPCPAVTGLPSCDRIYVFEYGYVTIAMIALNIFVLLGIILYAVMNKDKFSETPESSVPLK